MYGVSNSLNRMSGTFYLGFKHLTGQQQTETNLDNPDNVGMGLYQGGKSFGREVKDGILGVYKTPAKKVRE